jgi:hypothetical protein
MMAVSSVAVVSNSLLLKGPDAWAAFTADSGAIFKSQSRPRGINT